MFSCKVLFDSSKFSVLQWVPKGYCIGSVSTSSHGIQGFTTSASQLLLHIIPWGLQPLHLNCCCTLYLGVYDHTLFSATTFVVGLCRMWSCTDQISRHCAHFHSARQHTPISSMSPYMYL